MMPTQTSGGPPEATASALSEPAALVRWAETQAVTYLAPLVRRLAHVRGVAARAAEVAVALPCEDASALIAAAWLHDLGYSPTLLQTGCHQLDGAFFVNCCGLRRLAGLVAHHSEARYELLLRGEAAALAAYVDEDSRVSDALTYCDLTTGPDGERLTPAERLEDIRHRYGGDDVVLGALAEAEPHLMAAVARTAAVLRASVERV